MKRLFRGLLFAGRLFAGSLFRAVGPRRPTHPPLAWGEPSRSLAWGLWRPVAEWAIPRPVAAWAVRMAAPLEWSVPARVLRWSPCGHDLTWDMPLRTLRWVEDAEMSSTADQTLTITRGEDAVIPFTNASPPDGVEDWSLQFTIAARPNAVPVVVLVSDDGAETDGLGGILVTIPREMTSLLTEGSWRWDLWRTDTGSNTPLAGGNMIVRGSIRPLA